MASPRLNERELDLLVSYSVERDEMPAEAIARAFSAVDLDVFDQETTLHEWVDFDVLDRMDWRSGEPRFFSARVWDHRVVLTADEVRIYVDGPRGDDDQMRRV